MATPTYTLIDSVTLGSSASSVTFSSIDQSYGDLRIVINATSTSDYAGITYNLNSDTTTANYSWLRMTGDGSAASSFNGTYFWFQPTARLSIADPTLTTADIMDYSATDKHKTTLVRAKSIEVIAAVLATLQQAQPSSSTA